MADNRMFPMPEKIKTPDQELEMLARFAESNEYVIVKRAARRYIENLKNLSFTLNEDDPTFRRKHAEYIGQALGIQSFLAIIEEARAELARREGDKT